MASEEWKLCVDWLVRCKILPDDHRTTTPDAQAFDLAQALRDGVLLCHLLNALKPFSVDQRDFSPRPQLSQFLCLKNIRTFLQTCEKVFGIKGNDLFDPPDLFEVKNFRKVLHTLSKLSKSDLAQRRNIGGFPRNNNSIHDNAYYNTLQDMAQGFPPNNNHEKDQGEDIYGNLSDMAIFNDVPEEQEVHVAENVHEEKIYDDLCSLKRSTGSQAVDVAVRLKYQKEKAHDIVYTQWFRDGKANRDSQNCYYKNAKCQSCEGQVIDIDIQDNEELYDTVYHDGEDEIYEDLCSTKRKHRRPRQDSGSEFTPLTRRDHCIKEMVDTERNYVDALTMIVQLFIKPLKNTLSPTDREIIFSQIETLLEVHTGFHSELHRACTNGRPKIHEVFVKWKTKFLCYGEYCSNLPKAQEHISELTKKNENVKERIEECERNANEGRFRLRDLLHVPMQRVLKYHLLLRELIKNTDKKEKETIDNLQIALEAMQDLSLYVNEVKRDNEALQLIQEIQNSIVDLQMPQNTSLKDYGRLQKDGELKVRSHIDNKVRPRYIFLFDKVMLMGKSKIVDKFLWGETYSFKEAIVLAEYKVDSSFAQKDVANKNRSWNFPFQMVKQDNSMVYTFYAKTDDMKTKWIEAINLALDNTQPANGKQFVMTTFNEPKVCDICGKLLRGVFFQGYIDPVSKMCVHKECIGKKKQEQVPKAPPRGGRYKALIDYIGDPNPGRGKPVLKFKKDMIIDVSYKDTEWWKGRTDGNEGWFPAHLVEEFKQDSLLVCETPRRQPSYLDWKINRTPPQSSPPPCQNNQQGYVNVPADSQEYSKYNWYVGPCSRDKAAEMLRLHPDGTFLLRDSTNTLRKGCPALSIKSFGNVRHIKIEKNAENMYFMADTRYFHSLPELVDFYQHNSLEDSFPEVKTTLLYPYKTFTHNNAATNGISSPAPPRSGHSRPAVTGSGQRILSYAVAQYDYAATATTQISLKQGDRVAVLSKTGSDKGWWKGEHCDTHRVGYFPYAYVREEDDD